MRLTVYTDYAMRVLMYLGLHQDRLVTIKEVAEAFRISKSHLMKIANELQTAGYVRSVRGRAGGITLGRPAAEISLGEVIRLCEEDFDLVECFSAERNQCVIVGPCELQPVLAEALAAYFAVLDRYSLEDLLRRKRALLDILGWAKATPQG